MVDRVATKLELFERDPFITIINKSSIETTFLG